MSSTFISFAATSPRTRKELLSSLSNRSPGIPSHWPGLDHTSVPEPVMGSGDEMCRLSRAGRPKGERVMLLPEERGMGANWVKGRDVLAKRQNLWVQMIREGGIGHSAGC